MKLNSTLTTILLTSFILFFSLNYLYAQDAASDSTFYPKALVNSMAVYHQSFGNQSALYNGKKYGSYPFKFREGHPFFYSEKPVAGSVVYDGISYDHVLMSYDEITDVLVIIDQGDRIQLLSEKVYYFNLYNSDFIRLAKDSVKNYLEYSGFYNLLYDGKICLLKKQIKSIREVLSNIEILRYADQKNHYFIKKDEMIYEINSKKDLFKLMGDSKKAVQQFIKANKLNYRRDRQNMLTKATAYYDSLKK